jgi:hypothetical protein
VLAKKGKHPLAVARAKRIVFLNDPKKGIQPLVAEVEEIVPLERKELLRQQVSNFEVWSLVIQFHV